MANRQCGNSINPDLMGLQGINDPNNTCPISDTTPGSYPINPAVSEKLNYLRSKEGVVYPMTDGSGMELLPSRPISITLDGDNYRVLGFSPSSNDVNFLYKILSPEDVVEVLSDVYDRTYEVLVPKTDRHMLVEKYGEFECKNPCDTK